MLAAATARIPSFTPEWTNYGLEGDPGLTLIELFAFLTDSLLYRANRYPETNRLKFLQLLGVPLRPAAAATGIVRISNDSGPMQALALEQGVAVAAGSVPFVTAAPVNVLPLDAMIFYKSPIAATDPNYQTYQTQYEAIQLAAEAAAATTTSATTTITTSSSTTSATTSGSTATTSAATVQLAFYSTEQMTAPTAATPSPVVDLVSDTMDRALYVALLAPANGAPSDVISVIANQTLSLGIVPSLVGGVPPLQPLQLSTQTTPTPNLIYEMPANIGTDVSAAQYVSLTPLSAPDVLDSIGVVLLPLPGAAQIGTWTFSDPMSEGTGDFPPLMNDPTIGPRIVTWIRIRLPTPTTSNGASVVASAQLVWVGVNATLIYQAVTVVNEVVGAATGEPDQSYTLANSPVLPTTLTVTTQVTTGSQPVVTPWAQMEDLTTAGPNDMVYELDPEAGQITFGDGINGARPPAGARIVASYQYGGGTQGNVAIGAVSSTTDPRLQGGYSVSNPVPTSGGDLAQTVADAEQNIPSIIRNKDRLVTAQDFADVAMNTPGVDINRVDILPLFVPGPPPQDGVAGVVTLMVVPLTDPVNPLWPTPDRLFLGRVCSYLDTRRLVTTEVYVCGPDYASVYVSVGIAVQAGYFPDLVNQAVTTGLQNYLSSLRGLGPTGAGWPLRKTLLDKDLEAAVTRIEGVEYVDSLLLGGSDGSQVTEITFTGLQLPRLDGLLVVEGTASPLGSVVGTLAQPAQPGVSVVPVPVINAKC
ncbi:MAG TPA: putative baseplate assembly protein [Acetobacteraceae bacterium]|nr:putative baseplate assembly protein [Acetobacteraceae bacterium]